MHIHLPLQHIGLGQNRNSCEFDLHFSRCPPSEDRLVVRRETMKTIQKNLKTLRLNEEGAASVEYAVLIGALVGSLIAGLTVWGNFLQTLWQNATNNTFR
jgi:Flp pilus assembly pilin Flp